MPCEVSSRPDVALVLGQERTRPFLCCLFSCQTVAGLLSTSPQGPALHLPAVIPRSSAVPPAYAPDSSLECRRVRSLVTMLLPHSIPTFHAAVKALRYLKKYAEELHSFGNVVLASHLTPWSLQIPHCVVVIYMFGSLCHTSSSVRTGAIYDTHILFAELGKELGTQNLYPALSK